MKRLAYTSLLLFSFCATLCAQNNPAPLVNQPLVPASAAPGSSGFTLTVTGTGFVTGAVLNWNGSARTTTVVSSSQVQATITSADVAHIGTANVTVVNPAPGGGVSNVVYFPVRQPAASVAFAPEPGVSPAAGPIAVGDFNGDGKLDIAVGQTSSDGSTGSILFYAGLGNGTFASPQTTASTLPVQSLLAADLNGDGKLDLLIGTKNGDFGPAEGIAFINNGFGHFVEKTAFGTGDFGGPLAVGDLNGDGILDVVFGSEVQGSGTVYFYLGNGDGTFTLKSQQSLNTVASISAVGDFNGDGKLDVAVPEQNQMDIFIGNGDGTFHPYVPYFVSGETGPAAAADFNGDGKLDLAMGDLTILLGNGDGTFTVSGTYGSGGSSGLAIGDFNGDGKLDVASGTVETFLGNGDGTFQSPISSPIFSGNGSSYLPFGDFNRDGELDVAISGVNSTEIVLQTNLNLSASSLNFGSHRVGTISPSQSVTLTNVSSHSLPISSIALTGADPGDFLEHNNCGAGLHAGATCTVTVAFKPNTTGNLTASVTITYSGIDSPQTIALSGFGQ
jgi:hypothetical protein